ncbi:hypothetical protein G6F65_020485 [Rhizopus arrhizus]|nr:hypothetical protein G6F65_020485 [Rhizopus arrhizus]
MPAIWGSPCAWRCLRPVRLRHRDDRVRPPADAQCGRHARQGRARTDAQPAAGRAGAGPGLGIDRRGAAGRRRPLRVAAGRISQPMRAGHDRPVPGADGNRYRGPWRPASGDGQAAAATRRHGGAGLLRFFHAPALGLDRRADERAADRHGSLHAGQDC